MTIMDPLHHLKPPPSQCATCRHFHGVVFPEYVTCDAFRRGIPREISRNEHDHREAYEGDNGVRGEPEDGRNPKHPMDD